MKELSLNAERIKRYRKRRDVVNRIKQDKENLSDIELQDLVWEAITLFADYPFHTYRKLRFTYEIRCGEMFINRKDKSITRSSVDIVVGETVRLKWKVAGPKKLGVFGASYLYPIFRRVGLIDY